MMLIKPTISKDLGSIVILYGTTPDNENVAIPFEHRMFGEMLDSLTPEQRTGKDFIDIDDSGFGAF